MFQKIQAFSYFILLLSTLKFKMAATGGVVLAQLSPFGSALSQNFQNQWTRFSVLSILVYRAAPDDDWLGVIWAESPTVWYFEMLPTLASYAHKSAGWVHHRWDIDETEALLGSWSIILFIFIQNSVENNIIGRSMIGRIWKKQRKKKQQVCFCCTRFFLQKRSNLCQNK